MTEVCSGCGQKIKDTNKFCSVCGLDLRSEQPRKRSVISEHDTASTPRQEPSTTSRRRKSTVLGLPSIFPGSGSQAPGAPASSSPPAAPPRGVGSDRPAKRVPKKTMLGVRYIAPEMPDSGEGVAGAKQSALTGADTGATADTSSGASNPTRIPSETPRVNQRVRAKVQYGERFELPPAIARRKRYFRIWGVLLGVSIAWLVFRYLEAHV